MLNNNGTEGDDILLGSRDRDILQSLEGNDLILSMESDDYANGNQGDDFVNGNQGNDTVHGGQGNDIIHGGQGSDRVYGDLGSDLLWGDKGNDTVVGGCENPEQALLDGDDFLFGNAGEDLLQGNSGKDSIFGGKDNDIADGGKDSDIIYGDKGSDSLYGDEGDDSLFGGSLYTPGEDSTGRDLLAGGAGNDYLNGNENDDSLYGEAGCDILHGGKGNDLIFGNECNDILYGDKGADTLTGGTGRDLFAIGKNTGGIQLRDADIIADFQPGKDAIALVEGQTFANLNILSGTGDYSGDTIIQDKETGEYLAILQGVDSTQITADSFTTDMSVDCSCEDEAVSESQPPATEGTLPTVIFDPSPPIVTPPNSNFSPTTEQTTEPELEPEPTTESAAENPTESEQITEPKLDSEPTTEPELVDSETPTEPAAETPTQPEPTTKPELVDSETPTEPATETPTQPEPTTESVAETPTEPELVDSETPTEPAAETPTEPEPEPENKAPTDIGLSNSTIEENIANGTIIATLTSTDPDAEDTHSYGLVENGGGRFAIDGDRLIVADGTLLDYEINSQHQITIRTTDSAGNSFEKVVQINVSDVEETEPNTPPTIAAIADLTTDENQSTEAIAFTVGDSETPATDLTVTASSSDLELIPNDNISLSGSGSDRSVTITPAADRFGTATITLAVSDGSDTTTETFNITVTESNIPPVAAADKTVPAIEGGENVALEITAPTDSDGDELTITVSAVPTQGTVRMGGGGAAVAVGESLTIEQLSGLEFQPDADANGEVGTFEYTVSDGSESDEQIVTFAIAPVNDRPTFTLPGNRDRSAVAGGGTYRVDGFATFDPGATNESEQSAIKYIISTDNPSIFAEQPAIDPVTGDLTFTPVDSIAASTTATVTVQVQDDGGTENGGVDTSLPQTFELTVNRPEVSISGGYSSIIENAWWQDSQFYRIERSGSTAGELTVNLAIDESSTMTMEPGGAFPVDATLYVNGTPLSDYSVTIPDGESYVDIELRAIDDTHAEADETLQLNLAPGDYEIGNSSVIVTIDANDMRVISLADSYSYDPDYTQREGSLRQAILNANDRVGLWDYSETTTIAFEGEATSGTINLKEALPTITRGVTIAGPGANNLTIQPDPSSESFRIFKIQAYSMEEVTLEGLTIANGYAPHYYPSDVVTTQGGGIYNQSSTLNVINSILSGNRAYYQGGGIYNNRGIVNVINSTLSDNSADNGGGGIYNESGIINLTNSSITNNSADFGGGIYNKSYTTGTLNITGSTFSGNEAEQIGGGLYNAWNSTAIVTDSELSSNTAQYDGGAIYNQEGTLKVNNSTVSANAAREKGGGIYNDVGTVEVGNTTVSGNATQFAGGGIYNYQGTLKVGNSTVSGNTANLDGGGINNDFNGTAIVIDSEISDNTADYYGHSDGGGISNRGTLIAIGTTLSNNSASNHGGGIYNPQESVAAIVNSNFSNNSADRGGGISNRGTLSMTHSTLSGNQASMGGGIWNAANVSLSNSTLSENQSDSGGGIAQLDGTFNLANSTLVGNSADYSGGGIFYVGDPSLLNITNSTLYRNHSAYTGGGIYMLESGTIEVGNTIIAGNTATALPSPDDIQASFVSNGYNIIGTNTYNNNGFTDGVNNDQVGTWDNPIDPKLEPLQDNGGPTPTMALQWDSPALNAGNPEVTAADQRGVPRSGQPDIGAFETNDAFLYQPGTMAGNGTIGDDIIYGGDLNDDIYGMGGDDIFMYGMPTEGTDGIAGFDEGDRFAFISANFGNLTADGFSQATITSATDDISGHEFIVINTPGINTAADVNAALSTQAGASAAGAGGTGGAAFYLYTNSDGYQVLGYDPDVDDTFGGASDLTILVVSMTPGVDEFIFV